MDHSEAVRLHAVEKYVLKELPPEQQEEFEAHYFDCAECARDLQALFTFLSVSRKVLEEQPEPIDPSTSTAAPRAGWFSWLRPVIAVPAMAAMAAILIFQNVVTIPGLHHQVSPERAAVVYESSYRLQGATRGENVSKISIHPDQGFALDFDFAPSRLCDSYQGSLINPQESVLLTFDLRGEAANKELHLVVPGNRLRPGMYALSIVGQSGTAASQVKTEEVLHIPFMVEYLP